MIETRNMEYKTKIIAPRLANGNPRVSFGHGLPEQIKEGLRTIAIKENKSMSWVMEEIIIEYFDFDRPKYLERKVK
jgi:hypothetical protein